MQEKHIFPHNHPEGEQAGWRAGAWDRVIGGDESLADGSGEVWGNMAEKWSITVNA